MSATHYPLKIVQAVKKVVNLIQKNDAWLLHIRKLNNDSIL